MCAPSVTSVCLREKGGSGAGATAASFPRMSNRSVHPPEATCNFLPRKKPVPGDRGADWREARFQGQETEAWMEKHILSHGATFRSLLACFGSLWFLDLAPESPTNGEQPPEDPPHPPACVKGAAPLARLRSDKTSTLTLFL